MFTFIDLDFLDTSDEEEDDTYIIDLSQIIQPKIVLDKLPLHEGDCQFNIKDFEVRQSNILTGN